MTLRLRLVIGLVVLVLVGLVAFGVTAYSLYSRSERDRLDDQLRSSVPSVTSELFEQAGLDNTPGPSVARPTLVPFGTYAALTSLSGELLQGFQVGEFSSQPDLTTVVADPGRTATRLGTVDSVKGSGEWRVVVTRTNGLAPLLVVVAIPTREVEASLDRLLLIELSVGGAVLIALAAGSWLLLRRGLRPLEQMADATRSIVPGATGQRVDAGDARSEVGQLGIALNSMLTEMDGAFAERDQTEQRLRQFLADASHELRTPLTSIQGFAELFRLEANRPDLDVGLLLRRIEQESARMAVLVDDLLLLARLDQRRRGKRRAVDLRVLAADACTDARAVAPDRPVVLDAAEPAVVDADAGELRQAIGNLVANAIWHTPAGTPIAVSVAVTDAHASVTVRDHGPGLGPDALEHAFDRFWQADPARVGAGSGLGLSIVAGIVDQHGGSVSAANAPGGGAVFAISLPLAVAASAQPSAAGEVVDGARNL